MAIQDKATLDALILSLFPTGTGNISAADIRQYLDDILDSNVLQSFTAVTDTGSVIAISSTDVDQNAPRLPTNATSTAYTLPEASTVKEGVALIVINKASVPRSITLFGSDTVSGLPQIDKPGVWQIVADPDNDNWLSIFQVFEGVSNVIPVTTEADFPAPVAGVVDIGADVYELVTTAGVTFSSVLKFSDSRGFVKGQSDISTALIFTRSAASANIINDTGISVRMETMAVQSANAPLFDCVGDVLSLFTLDNITLSTMADIGQVDSFVGIEINSPLIASSVTGGLDVLGTPSIVNIRNTRSAANNVTPTFSFNDAGLSIGSLAITGCAAPLLTTTNQFADIDPTKITEGLVSDCTFAGTQPLGTSIDNETANFVINQVAGVESTRKIGSSALTSPITVTISVISTPVEVGGTWATGTVSQFSLLSPGIQFDGIGAQDVFLVTASISGTKPGGTGSNIYTGAIYNNDVLIASSLDTAEISDKGGRLLMATFTTLTALDHLTLYVSNEDNTDDLDVISAEITTFRVR